MQNPSLKQRTRKGGRSTAAPKSRNVPMPKRTHGNSKKRGATPACFFFFLGIVVLLGLFYVDQLTHQSLRRKMRTGNGTGGKEGFSPQEVALNAVNNVAPYADRSLSGDADGKVYHLIFSTDCSEFQHWQSYLMFHTALKVNQPGTITRIASGCSDEEAILARQWHKEHVTDVMGERFVLHLTPRFSGVTDADGKTVGDYKFFNKPFGLKHWLENAIGFADEGNSGLKNDDDVVILIDPDMALLRPITGDFSNDRDVVIGNSFKEDRKLKVEHGSPFAQKYGLGSQWRTFDLLEIAGPDSPASKVSQSDGGKYYPVGPPYLATVRDMHAIAGKWTEYVPRVHKQYPYLLAEMYAFCIAAAHLELPFQLIESLMVSNTGSGGEGWPMVDKLPHENLCEIAKKPNHEKDPVPSVIHLCQRYAVGEWFFSKRKMVKTFFECDSPLLEEPPSNIVLESDYQQFPKGARKDLDSKHSQREGFMVCGIIGALNAASRFFKAHHCNGGNMETSMNLRKLF